jgi:hypothetical protein
VSIRSTPRPNFNIDRDNPKEIMRCPKRYVAREIFGVLCKPSQAAPIPA